MAAFVLDHNFVTGLSKVDRQHHSLVSLFNELEEAFVDGATVDDDRVEDVFSRMVAYARLHFSDEEALMREVGLDGRHQDMHHLLHEQFFLQVANVWGSRSHMSHPSELFIGFLTSWLGLHILGIDQDMAHQIARVQEGQTPRQAFDAEASVPQDSSAQSLLKMVAKLYRMLSDQNTELVRANVHLEERVLQRTRELEDANAALRHANSRLEIFSRTDGLLRIANRQCFDERLKEECARAQRDGQPLGLLMIDVDFFKRFNDLYGHQEGDHCLQAIAAAAASVLRRPTDLLARYGGEELGVVLPNTDTAGAHAIALRICEAVAECRLLHAASLVSPYVTVSIGVAVSEPPDFASDEGLVLCADRALYRAKHQGRNRVVGMGDLTV